MSNFFKKDGEKDADDEVDFYDFDLPKMVVPEPPMSTRNI